MQFPSLVFPGGPIGLSCSNKDDFDGEALSLNGIGQVYIQLREVPRALEYFN